MGIIDDLNKIVEGDFDFEDDFEKKPFKKIISKDDEEDEDEEDAGVDEVIKHLDAVKSAAEYLDSLTTDEGDNSIAFEAERALRDAIQKMEQLSKDLYKSKAKTNKKELE